MQAYRFNEVSFLSKEGSHLYSHVSFIFLIFTLGSFIIWEKRREGREGSEFEIVEELRGSTDFAVTSRVGTEECCGRKCGRQPGRTVCTPTLTAGVGASVNRLLWANVPGDLRCMSSLQPCSPVGTHCPFRECECECECASSWGKEESTDCDCYTLFST